MGQHFSNFSKEEGILTILNPLIQNFAHAQNLQGEFVGYSLNVNGKYLSFSLDGQYLVVEKQLLNLSLGQYLLEFGDGEYNINSVTFSPDGPFVAIIEDDEKLRIWNLLRQQLTEIQFSQLSFSPNQQYFVTSQEDNKVYIWNCFGEPITHFDCQHPIYGLAISSDGKCIATAESDVDYGDENNTISRINIRL